MDLSPSLSMTSFFGTGNSQDTLMSLKADHMLDFFERSSSKEGIADLLLSSIPELPKVVMPRAGLRLGLWDHPFLEPVLTK